jgi:hypothetical protein
MVPRRTVLSGAAAGLAATALPGLGEAAVEPQGRDDREREIVDTLRQILGELRDQRNVCGDPGCAFVDRIRQNQKIFFKANGKFPDFVDVGVDVWERLYDWHVRTMQPLNVTRLGDGRLSMSFMLSTLVLRADVGNDFVSQAYDAK